MTFHKFVSHTPTPVWWTELRYDSICPRERAGEHTRPGCRGTRLAFHTEPCGPVTHAHTPSGGRSFAATLSARASGHVRHPPATNPKPISEDAHNPCLAPP